MHSCLYEGQVQHERQNPLAHKFDYPLMMAYLDLDEIAALVSTADTSPGILSRRRFAPASFLESDHASGFDTGGSLASRVRNLVEKASHQRPAGPIRLLTQLRYFGHYFSPLNLYYCYQAATSSDRSPKFPEPTPEQSNGEQEIQAVVAEVSNTPWNERHHYVLHRGNQLPVPGLLRYQHPKTFHVSPFMSMEATYEWQLNTPGKTLIAQIKSRCRDEQPRGELVQSGMFVTSSQQHTRPSLPFRATMVLHRRELSCRGVRALLFRYPLMNARILAAIYWQAFLLWKEKCPFFPHP